MNDPLNPESSDPPDLPEQESVLGRMDLRARASTDGSADTGLPRLVTCDPSEVDAHPADYRILLVGNADMVLDALTFVGLAFNIVVCASSGTWSSGVVSRVDPHLIIVADDLPTLRSQGLAIKSLKAATGPATPLLIAAPSAATDLSLVKVTSGATAALSTRLGADEIAEQLKSILHSLTTDT